MQLLLGCNGRARLVTLGPSILRTETAGIVAPALALYELGGMGIGRLPLTRATVGRALFGYTVVNLGCKVNRVEADGFERLLGERGVLLWQNLRLTSSS